jgi:hypothetical protein
MHSNEGEIIDSTLLEIETLFDLAADNLKPDTPEWDYFRALEMALGEMRAQVGAGLATLEEVQAAIGRLANNGDLYALPAFIEALEDCAALETVAYDVPSGDLEFIRLDGDGVIVQVYHGDYTIDGEAGNFDETVARLKTWLTVPLPKGVE